MSDKALMLTVAGEKLLYPEKLNKKLIGLFDTNLDSVQEKRENKCKFNIAVKLTEKKTFLRSGFTSKSLFLLKPERLEKVSREYMGSKIFPKGKATEK